MNNSYDKQLILDFIEWMDQKSVFLYNPSVSDEDIYKLVEEYLEGSD